MSQERPASAPAPEACTTMADVREGVDALDRELIDLLVIRQGYMEAAARIKPERADIYDAERVGDVLQKIVTRAAEQGLSRKIAEPVWRQLMSRCIAHELETYDQLHPVVEKKVG